MKPRVNVFWFRRDLRLEDNAGLWHALKAGLPVLPLFIFDRNILDELEEKKDRRVEFIHQALTGMQAQLTGLNSALDIRFADPISAFNDLVKEYSIEKVFANDDYEPYATKRDGEIASLLGAQGIGFQQFKDQVIFEKAEVMKDDGKPYTVFTPYSRKWKGRLHENPPRPFSTEKLLGNFYKQDPGKIPALEALGFEPCGQAFPSKKWEKDTILHYSLRRDFPAIEGTTRLSVHLRFGTISMRELAKQVGSLDNSFLNELIWRDFYQMILWHFPQVVENAFKPQYDKIRWRNDEKEFEAWCKGKTGYPIVDAGMRELNETGYMHNRVRMIVASFLTKHLLIDWRWGEAYFAKKLLDYDLAANNGGWQWAAGSGCDAAPYFRIFNPTVQAKKFDPDLIYIRRWVTEIDELSYSPPLVEHAFARQRCLDAYAAALKK